jgi:hypothetical protein
MLVGSDISLCVSFPVGNKRFRDSVTYALKEYMEADSRFEKSLVVHSIVDTVRAAGGRFLKRDFQLGKWYELSDQQAKEKVGHAIRDAVSSYENKNQKDEDKDDKNKKQKALSSYESKNQKDEDKNKKQKAVRKGRPRSERKDSGDSDGSSGTAPRSIHESLAAVSGRLIPSVASISGHVAPSHAIPDTAVSARSIDDDGHDHHDQQFLAEIDAVLGPLPPDARDPMEPYLKRND